MDELANQVTLCWLPAKSALPVHGYDVEFIDLTATPDMWCRVNTVLINACKMTSELSFSRLCSYDASLISVADLTYGHHYGFRVIAHNAMGYSQPSEMSEVIIVGQGMSNGYAVQPNGLLFALLSAAFF